MNMRTIKEIISTIDDYYSSGFRESTRSNALRTCREFERYLNEVSKVYSEEIAQDWLTNKMVENSGNYLETMRYYRAINLIIFVHKKGFVDRGIRFNLHCVPQIPTTCLWKKILGNYLHELDLEDKAESTIGFARSACTKFIKYLEDNNCLRPQELTREICKQYEKDDTDHYSLEGKRAYQYRIRQFIRHLERKGLVDLTIEYAINTIYAIPKKVVTILSDEQKKIIMASRKAQGELENRSYAMSILALYLGLRSVDIINLRFQDISWTENTITVLQQKTKSKIVLPLTPVVGNALTDYILNHRPESDSPQVFVSSKFPHDGLNYGAGYTSSLILLGKKENSNDSRGLHIMRRTFATNLVRNNVVHSTVSSLLGHANPDSIDPYLNLNSDRMRECALNLEIPGIPRIFQ